MKAIVAIALLLGGCDPLGDPPGGAYRLIVDHVVTTDERIVGVDSDGNGGLWVATQAQPLASSDACASPTIWPVTVSDWISGAHQTGAPFRYADHASQLAGLAVVHGQIWLDYSTVCDPSNLNSVQLRVIDPYSGAILRTYANDYFSSIDISAYGEDRLFYGGAGAFSIADATSGKYVTTRFVGFTDTTWQQGIAWRPGEVWIGAVDITVPDSARTLSSITVHDELGQAIGPVAFDPIPFDPGDEVELAFDRDQLVIGLGHQLIWMNIAP